MVDVNPVNKNTSVSVSSSGSVSQIKTTTPQNYYDGLAKQWAIDEGKVQNLDYSSKHYAGEAKQSAIDAENAKFLVLDAKDGVVAELVEEGQNQKEELIEIKNSIEAGKAVYIGESEPVDEIYSVWISPKDNETDLKIQEIEKKLEEVNSFNIFDTKTTDYILQGKEALGWALQGTYVTKESYPNFYNKCLEEKNNATATETSLGESTLTMFVHSNGHQFYNIAEKSIVDTFYETFGIADFYGIDEENERIFLPRFNPIERILIEKKEPTETDSTWYNLYSDGWLEQGGNAKTSAGTATVTLLKPYTRMDYTMSTAPIGSVSNQAFVFSGSYVSTSQFKTQWHGATSSAGTISWRTAGYSNFKTDLPSKYTYYCVGNTEVTQAITNVTEVTTSENDTIPMYTGQYFDFNPNHPAWLKGGEQVKSAGIYTSCYEGLVEAVNGTNPRNLKVINKADMVSGVVYDEYWILDQDNLTFGTPLTISNKALSGRVAGNGMTFGLTNGDEYFSPQLRIQGQLFGGCEAGYGQPYGLNVGSGDAPSNNNTIGVTTDPTKSGIEAKQSTAQLYFKVANAVQNLELLNAGKVLEAVNNIIPNNSELITSYGMPDYSAGVEKSIDGFTAEMNGILNVDYKGSRTCTIFVNGIQMFNQTMTYGAGAIATMIPLSKGDVVTQTNNGNFTEYTFTFYPLKGVK